MASKYGWASRRDFGPFVCRCGEVFKHRRYLMEHIALLNPHWPMVCEADEHKRVYSSTTPERKPFGQKASH